MAIFYGSNSAYLKHKSLKYFAYAALLPLVLLGAAYLALKIFSAGAAIAIAIAMLLVLAKFIEPLMALFEQKSGQFYRGRSGESEVRKILQELPNNYSVFQGVVLEKGWGDIDFVVVGPAGIFVIEVKSQGGVIEFNGQNLTVNNRAFAKNFLKQTLGEAGALNRYLQAHLGRNIYIHPVLAFSHNFATVRFGREPVQNVYVVQKDALPNLLYSFPEFKYPLHREQIEAVLKVSLQK